MPAATARQRLRESGWDLQRAIDMHLSEPEPDQLGEESERPPPPPQPELEQEREPCLSKRPHSLEDFESPLPPPPQSTRHDQSAVDEDPARLPRSRSFRKELEPEPEPESEPEPELEPEP